MRDIRDIRDVNGAIAPSVPAAVTAIPVPLAIGYGVCKNRMVCHCSGYRGMNNQPCQVCGCGFGMHW